MSIDTSIGLRLHRYVRQKVIILSGNTAMNRGIKHMYDHVHCTAGELLALQPTMSLEHEPWESPFLDLDFGVRANNGCRATREFRHMTCFPAPTQLITVSQENTRRCPLSAVVTHFLRSFSAVWIYARYWTSTTMLLTCVMMGSAKDISRRGRYSRNALEVGDAKQSSVLSVISRSMLVIVNCWRDRGSV